MKDECKACQLDLVLISSLNEIRYQRHFDALALNIEHEIKLNDEYLCGYLACEPQFNRKTRAKDRRFYL